MLIYELLVYLSDYKYNVLDVVAVSHDSGH